MKTTFAALALMASSAKATAPIYPQNCFEWNNKMWKGVPRNEDPVWTECGLEECLLCPEIDTVEMAEGIIMGALDLNAEDVVGGKLQDCLMDAEIVLLDVVSGIQDVITMHNEQGVKMLIWQVGAAIYELKEVLADCVPFAEIYQNKEASFLETEHTQALYSLDIMANILENPLELEISEESLEINGNEILTDIKLAEESFEESQWGNVGYYLGDAAKSVIGGPKSLEQISGMLE